ncbi:hypothetical protein [Micromonospora sp. CPCC 206061]|uniref:hypothetical protein n=1 Tax=Micromonospora sp. CPCC 206061 TaxID=3122410 RepID=UPI002FF39382
MQIITTDGMPPTLRRRLRSLAAMELVNIPLQGVVWFGLAGLPATLPNLVGFGLFAALLIEGAAYWAAKLHQLRRRRRLPGLSAFRAARAINPPFLATGVVITGYAAATDPGRVSWPGLVFALFACLEHVNYFHVQLMHDTLSDLRRFRSVGLRPSHLARDIARARQPPPPAGRSAIQPSDP